MSWGEVNSIQLQTPVRRCHLCCIAHTHERKLILRILRVNPRLEAPLSPFFWRTTFRNSTITPALPLIRKFTTLRSSRWCSHFSVAKRHQFYCPLLVSTATLSLKFENVFADRSIRTLSYCGRVFFFAALPSMSSTRNYEYFSKMLLPCNVFF